MASQWDSQERALINRTPVNSFDQGIWSRGHWGELAPPRGLYNF